MCSKLKVKTLFLRDYEYNIIINFDISIPNFIGLAGELRPDLEIQPFCKLTLTPGKKQQQQSVIKRGRDVVFNQAS